MTAYRFLEKETKIAKALSTDQKKEVFDLFENLDSSVDFIGHINNVMQFNNRLLVLACFNLYVEKKAKDIGAYNPSDYYTYL